MKVSNEESVDLITSTQKSFMREPERIERSFQSLVSDYQGRIATFTAYFLFSYMYGLTLLYGIWDLRESGELTGASLLGAIISTIFYTFFFTMMILSHVLTVVTSPGEMPKGY